MSKVTTREGTTVSSFELHLDTDNAAFDGTTRNHEVARLLRKLADKLDEGETGYGPIFDVNGNRVGGWEWKGWEGFERSDEVR